MVINTESIIGKRFGRLVVFSYAERNKYNKTQVSCTCDCGATKIVLLANLKNKLVKSCGCLKKDASASKNVKKEISPGMTFERLTVLREDQPKNGLRQVLCKCECGNEKVIALGHLTSKSTKSCGCYLAEIIEGFRSQRSLDSINNFLSHAKTRAALQEEG